MFGRHILPLGLAHRRRTKGVLLVTPALWHCLTHQDRCSDRIGNVLCPTELGFLIGSVYPHI